VDLSAAVGPTSGGNPALGGPASYAGEKAKPKG
jgi:hypothetical protein